MGYTCYPWVSMEFQLQVGKFEGFTTYWLYGCNNPVTKYQQYIPVRYVISWSRKIEWNNPPTPKKMAHHPLLGGFIFFNVHPYFGKWSNFTISYFSNGLVQPPTVTPPFNTTIPLSLQPSNTFAGIPCFRAPWLDSCRESPSDSCFFSLLRCLKNQRYLDFESMLLKKTSTRKLEASKRLFTFMGGEEMSHWW